MQPGPTASCPTKRLSMWALIVGTVSVLVALGFLALEVRAPAATAAPTTSGTAARVRSSAAAVPVRSSFAVARKAPVLRRADPWN